MICRANLKESVSAISDYMPALVQTIVRQQREHCEQLLGPDSCLGIPRLSEARAVLLCSHRNLGTTSKWSLFAELALCTLALYVQG